MIWHHVFDHVSWQKGDFWISHEHLRVVSLFKGTQKMLGNSHSDKLLRFLVTTDAFRGWWLINGWLIQAKGQSPNEVKTNKSANNNKMLGKEVFQRNIELFSFSCYVPLEEKRRVLEPVPAAVQKWILQRISSFEESTI